MLLSQEGDSSRLDYSGRGRGREKRTDSRNTMEVKSRGLNNGLDR